MRWKRRKTWRDLWERPIVFLANPSTPAQKMDNAAALLDLFDLMVNVRMQPGAHRFIFDESCRLNSIVRMEVDQ